MNVLVRLKHVKTQPPPLPSGTTLDMLSLAQLKNAVQRANQLLKNLESDEPRPVRLRTLLVDPGVGICCIPGTNLVMTHTRGTVSCWDILTSYRVGLLEIPDLRLRTSVLCLEERQKAVIGACIGWVENFDIRMHIL